MASVGLKKCNKQCVICPYMKEGKQIRGDILCDTRNMSILQHVKKKTVNKNKKIPKYIGESEKSLKDRICEHLGYVIYRTIKQATGIHFNLPGPSKVARPHDRDLCYVF